MNKPYVSTADQPPKNAAAKRYREKREWYIERNKRRKQEFRDYYFEAKDKPCLDCGGVFDPIVMEFDHRDPTTKLFNVSQPSNVSSLNKLKEEIAKCDVVCSNCHKIRTWGRIKS